MKKLIVICLGLFISSAKATLIDFESTTNPASCNIGFGGTVDGFTLSNRSGPGAGVSSGGFNNTSTCFFTTPTANSGDKFMLNAPDSFAEFTRDVGNFSLNSLFVHADARLGDATVLFQGLDGVGGNVLYSLSVDITASWQQVVFADWDNVKTFSWDSVSPDVSAIAIDDFDFGEALVVDTPEVSEPASVLLMALGLFGLVMRRKYSV